MGMVLEYQEAASYAAGSLGGTLGRLGESLRRLSRAHCTGSREKPGETRFDPSLDVARLVGLNQTLHSMADAWQAGKTAPRWYGRIDDSLSALKENALGFAGRPGDSARSGDGPEYQRLAQTMANLQSGELHFMER